MVYQNPGAALNPSIRVGAQVAEAFTVLGASQSMRATDARGSRTRPDRRPRVGDLPIPAPALRRHAAARVVAMALAKDPALLILDEPTTGLDATVEAEVLDLVSHLQSELHTSVLFISHNLGVISKMCSRVGVLYAGRLVEEGPVDTVLRDPRHPYTVGLLRCIPRGGVRKDHGRLDTIPGFLPSLGVGPRGLCVRRPLRARRRALPHRGAGAHLGRRRAREPLLVPRARTRPPTRGSRRPAICRASSATGHHSSSSDSSTKIFKQRGTRCTPSQR